MVSLGTYGIVFDEPADFPNGCRVRVEPVSTAEESPGILEEDWPATPEAMTAWLQWFDSFEPVEMTDQERADWDAWRQQTKEEGEVAEADDDAAESELTVAAA